MIDVELYFQANGTQRHKMPCLPAVGDCLAHGAKVWRVAFVVHSTPSTTWGQGRVDVYCLRVADNLCKKLERSWAAWSMKDKQHHP